MVVGLGRPYSKPRYSNVSGLFCFGSYMRGKMGAMSERVDFDGLKALAQGFVSAKSPSANGATVVGLKGDLGAGKTTFVKFVAETLGVKGIVTSPTFVIEKIYKLDNQEFNHLIHIDAYRLEGGQELKVLGWDEISSNSKNLIFIEWPERVDDILPKDISIIKFEFIDEKTREVDI